MKRILKKLLIILLILLILNNFFINSANASLTLGSAVFEILDHGIIGVLTYIYRVPMIIAGGLLNLFTRLIAWSEGATDASYEKGTVTVYEILFNKIRLIDINFFDIKADDDSLVNQVRVSVAAWYYIMRNVSAGILLIVFIYVGIRMAISTIASDRAMYKRMLVDWIASLALIFILQYIIILVIELNNVIINSINSTSGTASLEESISTLRVYGWVPGTTGLVCALVYVMLSWQTIGLLFAYFNRMLKLAFLIIIAPLISLTYSIDKMGDGKAQALDAWLKEFVFTVLMQPFHCIIYMSLISASVNILMQKASTWDNLSETVGAALLVFICISFTKEGEKIVRKIFAFKDDNKNTSLVAGVATASLVLNKAKNAGTGTIKAVNGAKNFVKNTKGALSLTNIRAEYRAFKTFMKSDNDKSYATLKSEAKSDIYSEQTANIAGKGEDALEKYFAETQKVEKSATDTANKAQNFESALEAEEERLKTEAAVNNKPVSEQEIRNLARLNLAKRARTEKTGWRRSIRGATTQVKNAKDGAAKFVRKIDRKLPFRETRALLSKSIMPTSMAMFIGAGTYGLNGKMIDSMVAATATKRAVSEITAGSVGTVKSQNEKLLENYETSSTDSEESENEKRAVLEKVASNLSEYSDSSAIDSRIREAIHEIDNLLKSSYNETDISNNITRILGDTKPGEFDFDSVKSQMLEVLASNAADGVDNNQILNSSGMKKLLNYGIEYGIAKNISNASSEYGITANRLAGNQSYMTGEKILREEAENTQIYEQAIERKTIDDGLKTKVKEMSATQLAALNRKFERQIEITRNLSTSYELENEDLKRSIERKAEEIEAKRDQLIIEAIKSVQGELSGVQRELAEKIKIEKEAQLTREGVDTRKIKEIINELDEALKK